MISLSCSQDADVEWNGKGLRWGKGQQAGKCGLIPSEELGSGAIKTWEEAMQIQELLTKVRLSGSEKGKPGLKICAAINVVWKRAHTAK